VLVQHRGEFDHEYLVSIAEREPERFRAVIVLDLAGEAGSELQRWQRRISGVRLPGESVKDHAALWRQAVDLGLRIIVDPPVAPYAAELREIMAWKRHGRFVVTHLGRPEFGDAAAQRAILELAREPTCWMQLSGFHQQEPLPYEKLRAWTVRLYESFGAERLLYGSNFPVMETVERMRLELEWLETGKLGIPRGAARQVLRENARRLWWSKPEPAKD
jgi:predicted TIM-barrel fold metal-dependent hydrolase